MKKKSKKKIWAVVLGVVISLMPTILLFLGAAGGILGITALVDGIKNAFKDDTVISLEGKDYDDVTIEQMIEIVTDDASFEYYFENCPLTQKQMKRLLKQIKNLNDRAAESAVSRNKYITYEFKVVYDSLYQLSLREDGRYEAVVDPDNSDDYLYNEDWTTYENFIDGTLTYKSSDLETLYEIDWQIIYALLCMQAASGSRQWILTDVTANQYIEGKDYFCTVCGSCLDKDEHCPICYYNEDISYFELEIPDFGFCTKCRDYLTYEGRCDTCLYDDGEVNIETQKIRDAEINAVLDMFKMDYTYAYDPTAVIKKEYSYEESQQVPFNYSTIQLELENYRLHEYKFWPAYVIQSASNTFMYTYYDVEKDENGDVIAESVELETGDGYTVTAYELGDLNKIIDTDAMVKAMSLCFDDPTTFDIDWVLEMVEQLPGGKAVARKYKTYMTTGDGGGRIRENIRFFKDVYVPSVEFYDGVKTKLEAEEEMKDQTEGVFDDMVLPDEIEFIDGYGGLLAEEAYKYLGVKYGWGDKDPTKGSVDCSGLVTYCLKKVDVKYGTFAYSPGGIQLQTGTQMLAYWADNYALQVSTTELQQGDVIWFATEGTEPIMKNISHMGIYLGNGSFIHSSGTKTSSEPGVIISQLAGKYEKRIVMCARYHKYM